MNIDLWGGKLGNSKYKIVISVEGGKYVLLDENNQVVAPETIEASFWMGALIKEAAKGK